MIRGSAPPIWENSLESDKLRAVPSAQSKKEPFAALFLCAAARLAVWKYGGGRHPHNLHPNPQPSAWVRQCFSNPISYGLCLRRRPKKSRKRLFFFARKPLLAYGNTPARFSAQSAFESAALGRGGTSQRKNGPSGTTVPANCTKIIHNP